MVRSLTEVPELIISYLLAAIAGLLLLAQLYEQFVPPVRSAHIPALKISVAAAISPITAN